MASPIPQNTIDAIEATIGVEASAITALNSIQTRIQAAVDAALANGATAAELQPVSDELAKLAASKQALADAIAANPTS